MTNNWASKRARVAPRRTYPGRAFAVAAAICIAGPLVGGLYFILGFGVKELVGPHGYRLNQFPEAAIYARNLIVAAYAIGLVPAVLSSIWIGRITYLRGSFGYGHAVVGAILMTIILPGIVFLMSLAIRGAAIGRPMSYLVVGVVAVLIGILSALTLRWMMGRLGFFNGEPS